MFREDRIKLIIAFIIFAAIGIAYFFTGKGLVTKITAGAAVVAWLAAMAILRKSNS